MQTPATRVLDEAGVDYEVTEYDPPSGAGHGAGLLAVTGFDPDTVGKTLVVQLDSGRFVLAVVPVSAELDLRALAALAGAKRASMAHRADAERLTGSAIGGISPLGSRRSMPVFVDEMLAASEVIHVSGGRRGLELSLPAADLLAATGATVGSIAT